MGNEMMKALSDSEIQNKMREAKGWLLEGNEIHKLFQFEGFMDAISFVNQIAAHAETVNHHPDITVKYNKVHLLLSTHDAGGLTKNDFDFAQVANGLFEAWASLKLPRL